MLNVYAQQILPEFNKKYEQFEQYLNEKDTCLDEINRSLDQNILFTPNVWREVAAIEEKLRIRNNSHC